MLDIAENLSVTDDQEKRMPLALVLSGGGARAAYQVGVLAAIAERLPSLRLPIVTGVSAGAINAAYLAAAQDGLPSAARTLQRHWGDLTSERIYSLPAGSLVRSGLSVMRRWRTAHAQGTALFDTRPLRAFLESTIDFARIDANVEAGRLRAVALSASSYATGGIVTFVHGRDVDPWRRSRRGAVLARLTVDHVMASSAIPLAFPPVQIGGSFYGDGSIRQDFPLSPAIHLGAARILAIATRRQPDRADVSGRPPSAGETVSLVMDSVFGDALDADAEMLTRINQLVGVRPDPASGFRRVGLLVFRPSRDLRSLAPNRGYDLPHPLRTLARFVGAGTDGRDFLSYLLFTPLYTNRLMELGYDDAIERWPRLEPFLAGSE